MAEDMFKAVPEDVLQYIKNRYEEYKATAKEPVLNFEDYFFKVYDLALDTVGLINKKEMIEEEIIETEQRIKELNEELAEIEAEELLEDFNKVYGIIVNEVDLTQEEKLDKLKAYYYTVVRNIAKEFKFLNKLNEMIKEQDLEGYNDVLLINFIEFVKDHYD